MVRQAWQPRAFQAQDAVYSPIRLPVAHESNPDYSNSDRSFSGGSMSKCR